MPKQQAWTPHARRYPIRMEEGGWSPLLAPVPLHSPPHHYLAPVLACACACAAIAVLILTLLHIANGSLW
jgi:hypothetical protein